MRTTERKFALYHTSEGENEVRRPQQCLTGSINKKLVFKIRNKIIAEYLK